MASVRLETMGIVYPASKVGVDGVQKQCGEISSEGPDWKSSAEDLLLMLLLPCCPAASQSQPYVQRMPQQNCSTDLHRYHLLYSVGLCLFLLLAHIDLVTSCLPDVVLKVCQRCHHTQARQTSTFLLWDGYSCQWCMVQDESWGQELT